VSEGSHSAVLSEQAVDGLNVRGDGCYVDCTFGRGGHSRLILARLGKTGRLLALDRDPQAVAAGGEIDDGRFRILHGRFGRLAEMAAQAGITRADGILLDLGVSSPQLDDPARGFSFRHDAPLDMRMDPDRPRTAADIVNRWDEDDLADLFLYEGGEPRARKVAHAITESRRRAPFLRTIALADLVERTLGRGGARAHLHPATRVFQALRRAVNEEGDELRAGLALAEAWLVHAGRLAVISFHSGEDGAVKRFLADGARDGRWHLLHKKPLRASEEELHANRRARSAVLRCAERTRLNSARSAEAGT